MALEILEHSRYRIISLSVAGGLALILVAALGWGTFLRNQVWESDSALWMNAIAQSPRNGRALMHYGQTRLAAGNPGAALEYLSRAEVLAPHDPLIQVNLAFAYERLSRVTDSEAHFRRAVAFGPSWSPSYSWYAEWLFSLNRTEQASLFAARALALDPWDMAARRTMMDIMTDAHEWVKLKQFALDTLRLYPGDPDGLRTLQVAQNGIDDVGKAEAVVRTQPNVNNYLALSVLYFETERYQDCIDAAREALKINPDQAEAYANIAAAYHTMGKLDETIAALREEVRLNPNLPSAKANLDFELNARARAAGR
jgi:tetratricopeptide (TPR) repeat protein